MPLMKNTNVPKELGVNLEYMIKDDKLILTIDLTKEMGKSGSGKSTIVASSRGNKQIGDFKVGVNVYKKTEE